MSNGWTGGQYGLVRLAAGAFLSSRFAVAASAADGGAAIGVYAAAALAGVALAIGWRDREAALALLAAVAGQALLGPRIDLWAAAVLGWVLIAHALTPRAPFVSVGARGRADPDGGWSLPDRLYAASWFFLAGAHALHGTMRLLDGPGTILPILEITGAAMALVPRARLWAWLALTATLVASCFAGQAAAPAAFLVLHAFTFDPAWLPARTAGDVTLFYDGECGLCHRAVRFILAEDRTGIRFAPLQGSTPPGTAGDSLDTVVVRTPDGALLERTRALLHVAGRIGGLWRVLGRLVAVVPFAVTDRLYDGVARARHGLFARPKDHCPIVPAYLRDRFRQ